MKTSDKIKGLYAGISIMALVCSAESAWWVIAILGVNAIVAALVANTMEKGEEDYV